MSQTNNIQTFTELEYCFQQYYTQNFAPIVESEEARFRKNKVEETRNRDDGGWESYVDSSNPFASTFIKDTSGEWNKKTTEDLLESCNKLFFKDPKVQEDINKMVVAWRAAIVSDIGVEKYKELSSGVPNGDLANYFVYNRFQSLFVEQLSKLKVPPKSFVYIMEKGFGESLPGLLVSLQMKPSDMDNRINQLAKDFYHPSAKEDIASFGLSFVLDSSMTGGYSSIGNAATWLSLDGAARLASSYLDSDYSFDQLLSKAAWGDSSFLDSARKGSSKLNPSSSVEINNFNEALNNKLYRPVYNENTVKENCAVFRSRYPSDKSELLVDYLNTTFKNMGVKLKNADTIPDWMKNKNASECYHLATYWASVAIEMKTKGTDYIHYSGNDYSLEQISRKSYQYALALDSLQKKAIEESKHSVNNNTTDMNTQVVGSAAVNPNPELAETNASSVKGWGSKFSQAGINDYGTIGKNLGYVLAMLPDSIISMFTGKSKNLRFQDNLMPIGMILAGMFVNNPVLKMMFIGLGGASMFSNIGREVLNNGNSNNKSERRYCKYGEEELDSRISNPAMKGNTLIMTIDNDPNVITVNEEAADAYYNGFIPLNTLANAVLHKYDEQNMMIQKEYIRSVNNEEEMNRSYGLK